MQNAVCSLQHVQEESTDVLPMLNKILNAFVRLFREKPRSRWKLRRSFKVIVGKNLSFSSLPWSKSTTRSSKVTSRSLQLHWYQKIFRKKSTFWELYQHCINVYRIINSHSVPQSPRLLDPVYFQPHDSWVAFCKQISAWTSWYHYCTIKCFRRRGRTLSSLVIFNSILSYSTWPVLLLISLQVSILTTKQTSNLVSLQLYPAHVT